MNLVNTLIEKAKKNPKRVALAECDEARTLQAARIVLDQGIGYPVLVNDPAVIRTTAEAAGVSLEGMEIVDITDEDAKDALVRQYYPMEKREFSEKSYRRKLKDPMAYAMMLEAVGRVDCSFQGVTNTTGDVLLTALSVIGLQEGVTTASIFALVETPGFEGPEGDVIVFTDCGLNNEPTAEELASIAIAAADNVRSIMSWEPRVAFLSFSTAGSGYSESVEKVRAALEHMRKIRPDIKSDGEFQLDTPDDPFFLKTYTSAELKAAYSSGDPLRYLSERFAAKEAVFKALRISAKGVRLNEIEVISDEIGYPKVLLHGSVRNTTQKKVSNVLLQ